MEKKKMPLWLKILIAIATAVIGVVTASFTSCEPLYHFFGTYEGATDTIVVDIKVDDIKN